MKMFWSLLAVTLAVTPLRGLATGDQSSSSPDDETQVAGTVRAMLAAAAANDMARFRAVTTPDFYTFDAGERFTRDALMDLVKKAQAAGKSYVWTVNEPEVRLHGDMAWISYVNRGSVTDASGTKNLTWLESAVLQKEQGTWRICFFHSSQAAEKKPAGD